VTLDRGVPAAPSLAGVAADGTLAALERAGANVPTAPHPALPRP
jgi:hypothetical protein